MMPSCSKSEVARVRQIMSGAHATSLERVVAYFGPAKHSPPVAAVS